MSSCSNNGQCTAGNISETEYRKACPNSPNSSNFERTTEGERIWANHNSTACEMAKFHLRTRRRNTRMPGSAARNAPWPRIGAAQMSPTGLSHASVRGLPEFKRPLHFNVRGVQIMPPFFRQLSINFCHVNLARSWSQVNISHLKPQYNSLFTTRSICANLRGRYANC